MSKMLLQTGRDLNPGPPLLEVDALITRPSKKSTGRVEEIGGGGGRTGGQVV